MKIKHVFCNQNLQVNNDGSVPTNLNERGQLSQLNATAASTNLGILSWKVLENSSLVLDHKPIKYKVLLHFACKDTKVVPNWKAADWANMLQMLREKDSHLVNLWNEGKDVNSMENLYSQLFSHIKDPIANFVPMKKCDFSSRAWWNPEIVNARQVMKRYGKKVSRLTMKKRLIPTDLKQDLKVRKHFQSKVKESKNKLQISFINELCKANTWELYRKDCCTIKRID